MSVHLAEGRGHQVWTAGQIQPTEPIGPRLLLQIKFYWHLAMLIGLHMVCGCFRTTKAGLSLCDRAHRAHEAENIHYLALMEKVSPSGQEHVTLVASPIPCPSSPNTWHHKKVEIDF